MHIFVPIGFLITLPLQNAEKSLIRAMDCKENLLGPWDPEVSHILCRLGVLYIELNQFNDAEACFERALAIREEKLGPYHSRVAQTLKHMITLYEMIELYDKAIDYGLRAMNVTIKNFGENHDHGMIQSSLVFPSQAHFSPNY